MRASVFDSSTPVNLRVELRRDYMPRFGLAGDEIHRGTVVQMDADLQQLYHIVWDARPNEIDAYVKAYEVRVLDVIDRLGELEERNG